MMGILDRTAWKRLFSVFVALVMLATACGGSDADGGDSASTTTGEDTTEVDTAPATDDTDTDDADDGAEPATDTGTDDSAEPASAEDGAMEDDDDAMEDDDAMAMAPARGGTLTMVVEAETDSWHPAGTCAASCIAIMRTVADPLTVVNADGVAEPFLLDSIKSNEDFTEYTLVMREGVTFHDGTPADGAAVQQNLLARLASPLSGQILAHLAEGPDSIVLADPMTVTVTFNVSDSTFPLRLAGSMGWLLAPAFLDNPDAAQETAIATGPFMMTEWTRDEQTVVAANPNYWRTNSAGEALPYLDGIEFRPVPETATRRAVMESGDADLNMDSTSENVGFWRDEWEGSNVVPAAPRMTQYLLMNSAVPPFDNPDLRRALVMCTDRDEFKTFLAPNNELANGPFAAGDLGYLEDSGYPTFDPEGANALLDEIGRPEVINYDTGQAAGLLLETELLADMWTTNCGLNVNIDQFDQTTLITNALFGTYEITLFRNHGEGHPGMEYIWWHSSHTEGLALNFGRIINEEMDALLEASRATEDPAELDDLGQQMNRIFGEEAYNLWLVNIEWQFPHGSDVHGVDVLTLPSGNAARATTAGNIWLQEAWVG